MFEQQKIIPAISSHQDLKQFFKTELTYGILMNFQLAQLYDLVQEMKAHNKKILIHSELIKGLASDEYGAIYLIQVLKVDGIISSKPKVIGICKKRGVLGIMRFFLKDTYSLQQSIMLAKNVNPDCLEILPAIDATILEEIKTHITSRYLLGGLITSKQQIESCLSHGAVAVTVSDVKLWNIQVNNK